MAKITINGVTYETFEDKNIIGTKHIDKICEYSGKIPDYVTSIGELWTCKNITIPHSVTSIGVLYHCENITIPDSVTSIGELYHCENITIPNSVTSIGKLYHCENITIPDSVTSIAALNSCSNITIPNSVTSIGELFRCSNITIPDSVNSSIILTDCKNMKITFPKGIKSLEKISGIDINSIPSTVTSIGNLNRFKDIAIPDHITSIGRFSYCSNITIPDSVTSIAELNSCSNITIPNSVTFIKGIHISTLTIPASVTTINEISGENGCLMLMMESKTPPTLAKAVYLAKDDTLTVPVGAAEAYKNHPMWGKFKNISERNIPASTNTKKTEPKPQLTPAPKAEPKKETPKPEVRRPSADDMNVLDRLIDAALEDFVLTDEERSVLLKKSKEIGLGEDEFKIYLNGKIQERMKDKPAEKVEEKKKGFFARLFGL